MLGAPTLSKTNMRTLKSRRAMLDTLMRHLDMVRLSAGVAALIMMGCTGLIDGADDTSGGGNLTPEQRVARDKFEKDAYPTFNQICSACHAGTDPSIQFLKSTSIDGMRQALLAYDPQVVNLDAPESSRVLTKGAHMGPALDAIASAGILGWIQAEKDAEGSSTGTIEIATEQFIPLLCTGGVAGDVAGCTTGDAAHCCPINTVALDSINSLTGASISFVAQPLASDLYVSDLYLKAGAAGIYLEHPLFVSWPATGNPIPDSIDRFFAVKMNLAATTSPAVCPSPSCDHIGAGAAAFIGFAPANKLSITFKVLDPFHDDAAPPPPPTGCGTNGFASFLTNVKPVIQTCQQQCHGGTNAGAKNAMDLSGLASTTDNNTCLQVRSHVNFQTVASSGILLAPQPGSNDTAHPFKLSTTSNPTIANFQSALNAWITVETAGN